MYSKPSLLAALLPVVTAQGSYGGGYGHGPVNGTYSLGWESLPGSIYLPTNDWANSNWPPQNVGMPLAPQAPDAELKELLEGVSIAQYYTDFDEFWHQTYINGTEDPNRVYVVTGHYDSRRIDINDYTNDAPGSDDDASGVAVVMELARLCATKKPKATMIFAATAGEEQGLYGSDHLAKTLKAQGYNVEADFNNDIVGTGRNPPFDPINNYTLRLYGASIYYPNASSAVVGQEVAIIGAWNDSPAQNLGRFVTEVAVGAVSWVGMQVALIYRPDRYLRGGDHESFLLQGFPAVRFTEAVEDFAHEHQDPRMQDGIQYGDLPQFVDFEYTSRVAKVNLASMWSAANAPALPVNVTISEVVGFPAAAEDTPIEDISNDSRFAWVTGKDKLVSSYEVVWRPSGALQWTHSLNVGMTGNVTLALNKDNVQVGVRAVGADGKKSPAVFPFPINA
ncbi:hypothetical protein B0A54_04662 [Friedmanniomyces endolithicus]|uniref:Peptide hydrolase n=1 Tax=Friedmanniomyces endolithicus TaxID=329885 RepID=A0A4U0V7D3_9PEZI|nr:hypothetical protein B0A54_04662 [Friedmanniomyces endolithicus]